VQRLPDAAGDLQLGYSLVKEFQDAMGWLAVEFTEFPGNLADNSNITVRIDAGLKDGISKAAQLEHRTLSNMGKLLLEYR
jgi:hypothetical protein